MIAVSDANQPNVDKNAIVRIKVPEVNKKVKNDTCSILAAVFSKTEGEFYTLGTTIDILKLFLQDMNLLFGNRDFYR